MYDPKLSTTTRIAITSTAAMHTPSFTKESTTPALKEENVLKRIIVLVFGFLSGIAVGLVITVPLCVVLLRRQQRQVREKKERGLSTSARDDCCSKSVGERTQVC